MASNFHRLDLALFGLITIASLAIAEEANNSKKHYEWLTLNSSIANSYYERGISCYSKQEWDSAIDNLSEAIRLNPTNTLAYEVRSGCYYAKRDFDKALNDLEQVIQFNPTNSRALLSRASAHSAKREFGKEIVDLTEALRLAPNNATTLSHRGFAHFRLGQFDKAVQDLYEALRLDPTNDSALDNLAWLRATCPVAAMRNGKEAVEAGKKACELSDWKIWSWIETLAAAYAEAGDFEQAIKYQKQVLKMDSVTDKERKEMQADLSLYQQHLPNHDGQKY